MDVIEIKPDIIELDELQEPDLKLDISETEARPSVNFGSGIELLMNDKKTEKKSTSNVEINDITKLEDELNDLAESISDDNIKITDIGETKNIFGGLFGNDKKDGNNVKQVFQNDNAKQPDLGKSTSNMNENKTWDGFGKFNNVPVNLDKVEKKPELTKEEELKERFKYLRKLEELEKKGVSLSKRYNMDSDLQEMIGEYETIIAEKEKSNSVKFQGKMLMACVTGLEFLNNKFDPFDIKLEGWGEQLNENIEEYDEIFSELHEKYKSKAKMSPELKLLFQLGGSAVMVHMSNTLFKSAMPGMDDIMRQNPELMKQFTSAAVNTMGNNGNPGFAGFMNNVFGGGGGGGGQPQNDSGLGFGPSSRREMPSNVNEGPPPEPVETKLPDRSQRTQNLPNRPDLMSARGISLDNEGYADKEQRISRPEMRGPNAKQTEINSLLSGLKTKQIIVDNKESSTISIEDLKELTNAKIPKSKRKQKSDKNIVSLDI
tara:strand:+ start:405 stop:1868 length:1464 start_codon:yes stop_codon:yes gene_type:complete